MLAAKPDALKEKAERLQAMLTNAGIPAQVVPVEGRVGGGSVPNQSLSSWAVALTEDVNALEQKLRLGLQPIVGRIHNDQYLLDVRTLWEADFPVIVAAVKEALA